MRRGTSTAVGKLAIQQVLPRTHSIVCRRISSYFAESFTAPTDKRVSFPKGADFPQEISTGRIFRSRNENGPKKERKRSLALPCLGISQRPRTQTPGVDKDQNLNGILNGRREIIGSRAVPGDGRIGPSAQPILDRTAELLASGGFSIGL